MKRNQVLNSFQASPEKRVVVGGNSSNTGSLRELFTSFCSSSTIHGTFFIKESKTFFGKVIWSFIILIGIGMSSWIIQKSFQSWKSNPIVTSVMQISIEEVEFPSITICHMESNRFGYVEQELNNIGEFTTDKLKKMLIYDSVKILHNNLHELSDDVIDHNDEELESAFCEENPSNERYVNQINLFKSYLQKYSKYSNVKGFNEKFTDDLSNHVLNKKDLYSLFEHDMYPSDHYIHCNVSTVRSFLFFHHIAQHLNGSIIEDFRFGTILKWLYDHASSSKEREELFRKYTPSDNRFFAARFGDKKSNCSISLPALISVLSGDEMPEEAHDCIPDNHGYIEDLTKIMLNSQTPSLSDIPFMRVPFCWYGEYEHRELTKNNTAYCRTLKSSISEDGNLCYSFNNKAIWKGLKLQLQEQEKSKLSHDNNGFKVKGCGKMKGLTVVLDANTMGKTWKRKMKKRGRLFKIFITEPGSVTSKVPFTVDSNVYGEHSFYIHGIHYIKSSEDFAKADRSIRKCNFEWEGNLTQFKSYNQANCLLECRLRNITQQCGCSPWYFHQSSHPVCDYSREQRTCYAKASEYFLDGECPCPSNCEMIHFFSGMGVEKYDMLDDINSYEWINPKDGRLRHYILDGDNLHSTDIYRRLTRITHGVHSQEDFLAERFKRDVAIVHFFFDTPVITQITTEMRLTIFDQISSIGGTLGLCTGVSIISFFEVFYWLIKFSRSQLGRLLNGIVHSKKKKINECFIQEENGK